MLPFGVTIPATVPQWSEIPEGLMNNPVELWENGGRGGGLGATIVFYADKLLNKLEHF